MKHPLSVFILAFLIHGLCDGQTIASSRLVDWTLAGSEEPNYIDFITISLDDYGLSATDPSANVTAFTNAFTVLGSSGGIISIPTGTYTLDNTVSVPSNIHIVGSGIGDTKLIFDIETNKNGFLYKGSVQATSYPLSSAITKGDNTLVLANALDFNVGDWVQVFFDDSDLVTSNWALGTVGQICQLSSVSSTSVGLEEEMRLSIGMDKSPYIKKLSPVRNSSISCLSIERQDGETIGTMSNIRFDRAVNCLVENISSKFCKYSHVEARNSSHLTIRNSYFEQSFDYGGGGNGYGVMLHLTTGDCLVENNIFKMLRHAMIVQAGANGNVFAYNYSREAIRTEFPSDASGDMVCHGNYTFANLFEQNVCQNIAVDYSHGANGPYNTFFRNQADNYGIIVTDSDGMSQNFVANEVTQTGGLAAIYNYTIPGGLDHFEYGNYNKGTLTPAGSNSIPEESYYYASAPTGWSAFYASIGPANTYNTGTNDAEVRYLNGDLSGQCDFVLPIQFVLKGFELVLENNQVFINWETGYENQIVNYTVEKYIDEKWVLVGQVDAGASIYSITDSEPSSGNNIYRLLANGYDNEFMVVRLDSIAVNRTNTHDVYKSKLVSYDGLIYTKDSYSKIEIYDIQGKLLYQKQRGVEGPIFDLKSKGPGIYIVTVHWDDNNTTIKKVFSR